MKHMLRDHRGISAKKVDAYINNYIRTTTQTPATSEEAEVARIFAFLQEPSDKGTLNMDFSVYLFTNMLMCVYIY